MTLEQALTEITILGKEISSLQEKVAYLEIKLADATPKPQKTKVDYSGWVDDGNLFPTGMGRD